MHSGLGEELSFLEKEYGSTFQFRLFSNGKDVANASVFLVGPFEENPVKLVQKISAADKHISIVVLAFPSDFQKTKQALQFAPFVGKNSSSISYSRQFNLQQALQAAALRTSQRRSFSKINRVPTLVASMASKPLKVQNLGLFLDKAPIGTLLVDKEENIIALNRQAKQIFSIDGEANLILKDIFPGLGLHQLNWKKNADEPQVIEWKNRHLELNLAEVENEEGEAIFIFLINDITEQRKKEKELRESEALFRLMAESLPQLVWTADENGYRTFFSHNWLTYSGKPFTELEGWQWTSLIHPDDTDNIVQQYKTALNAAQAFEYELRLLRHDGIYRWHLVRGVPHKNAEGKVLMWIGTNTDIHEQKAFAEELEQRVKERTYELETSNSELEQFVYITSHDLQEPLRKIRLFSDLVMGSAESLPAPSRNHLEKINATALRMSVLLKELLNFTQLNREEGFEPTDLNTIVEKAMEDLELVIQQKSAEVRTDKLPVINAVPVQMHQLFYNLINNALKFTRPGEKPVVEIRSVPPNLQAANAKHLQGETDYVEIVVKDNGIGFDQQQAQQIFKIFQRLHNRTAYTGTGIGLALCKKVVTHHYGDIYAISQPGKGAAFHVLLPKTQGEPQLT